MTKLDKSRNTQPIINHNQDILKDISNLLKQTTTNEMSDKEDIEKAIEVIDAMIQFKELSQGDLMEYIAKKYHFEFPLTFRIRSHYNNIVNALLNKDILIYKLDSERYFLTFPDDILQALDNNVFRTGRELIRPTKEKATILKLYLDPKYFELEETKFVSTPAFHISYSD